MAQVDAMFALLVVVLAFTGAAGQDAKVEKLIELRKTSKDAVIKLTEDRFKEFIQGSSRPYTAVVFFQAMQLVEQNPTLKLLDLRKEFGYAAKAFATGPNADDIFFFEAMLEDTQLPFGVFQVNSLPFVARIGSGKAITRPPVDLARADKMVPDTVTDGKYPWSAEVFVKYLSTEAIKAGEIDRPSFTKSPLFPVGLLLALVLGGAIAYRMYHTDFVRKPYIWGTGSLLVFWWSVSGGMYNYMRGMPLFIRDRNGKLQFFLQGRGGSLGAEGMIMGMTYVVFSLALALVTYAFPRINNEKVRGVLCTAFTALAGYSIYQTFTLWMNKTGYGIVQYLY